MNALMYDLWYDEEPPCRARVTRRDANFVWVQLELGVVASAGTGAASERH